MKEEKEKRVGMGQGCCKVSVCLAVAFAVSMMITGLLGLRKPVLNRCTMTYMYPTYIPIRGPGNATNSKYALYLYYEGWKKIDQELHLVKLSGVPVLFIPGNGGSYKQMRSIAAESDRAYNSGPLENKYYRQSSLTPSEAGGLQDGVNVAQLAGGLKVEEQYANHLDWFAVDLEGEQSAMDGHILEQHSEYVVKAVHLILDKYKDSMETRSQSNEDKGEILPKSVILVGHSMGGFVARAVVVHPKLRKGAVETVLTLSSPHQSAPLALQPSVGHFFSQVNQAWVRGFKSTYVKDGQGMDPPLSNVVVVSVSGGVRDYQVRSWMASLDGIVPPTNGLTIGSAGMVNVWLSMEHQSILWCNQMAVQVSHTLLQLIDKDTGQQFSSPQTRLAVFVANVRSALPQTFEWLPSIKAHSPLSLPFTGRSLEKDAGRGVEGLDNRKDTLAMEESGMTERESTGTDQHQAAVLGQFACPANIEWEGESPESDLYIESPTMTVLSMDGRRRWLDIEKLAQNGKDWFVLVTNLAPCMGLRVHLWPEKGQRGNMAVSERIVEMTMKMAQLPSGPPPPQIEPGAQTEQATPTGVLQLGPSELAGFRFVTISVAQRLSLSGRPSPAASMAVGQFFNPQDGRQFLSHWGKQEVLLRENHPMVWNLSVLVSLSTFPVVFSVKTKSCGIQHTVLPKEQAEPDELIKMCKARCFPPVGLVWDLPVGLEVFSNLNSETVVVDSSSDVWGSNNGAEQTSVLLLVDPHCAYDVSMKVSLLTATSRFLLGHGSQIVGTSVAVALFALMRQQCRRELDGPIQSVWACIGANFHLPLPFLALALGGPLLVYSSSDIFSTHMPSSLIGFMGISTFCYVFATGIVALLASIISAAFYIAAYVHMFLKLRSQAWEDRWLARIVRSCCTACSSFWVVRKLRAGRLITVAVIAAVLVFLVHPSLGLILMLLAHAWSCHSALYRYKLSFRSQDLLGKAKKVESLGAVIVNIKPLAVNFAETDLGIFHQCQGVLLLHLITTAMLVPSLVAWGQRLGQDQMLPSWHDSFLTCGLILHGLFSSNAYSEITIIPFSQWFGFPLPYASFIYCVTGLYCYVVGLLLAPYLAFYALAIVGMLDVVNQVRAKGEPGQKLWHSHKH